jgi:AbrB family looped-hinge helix DNA binding protein
MLATIDAGGRVVVPKDVRERLGLRPGMQVQLTEVDGALEITPMVTPMSVVERNGVIVLESERTMPTLTAEQVREVQESTRR